MKRAVVVAGGAVDEACALHFLEDAQVPASESAAGQEDVRTPAEELQDPRIPAAGKDRRCAFQKSGGFLIAADRGLTFLDAHGIDPDLIVGDFDSSPDGFVAGYRLRHPDAEVRAYNPEKDYTDTEIAVEAAREAGCREMIILGGTGTRLDHVLGNIQCLALLLDQGCTGVLADPHNRITMHDKPFTVRKADQWGHYVSLIPYGGDVRGLTLRGFHYEVTDFTLPASGSRGVSNEIDGEEASISFTEGRLLMIESKD